MREALFDVVFFGILQAGKDKNTAMNNMAQLFKTDLTHIKHFFSGNRKVIKHNINAAAAEKYIGALENIGLVVKLEASSDSTDAESDRLAQPVTDKTTASNRTPENHITPVNATLAPPGVDIIENPQPVLAQKIADISTITLAETGADILVHPVQQKKQKIADISQLSLAEVGSDLLEKPTS